MTRNDSTDPSKFIEKRRRNSNNECVLYGKGKGLGQIIRNWMIQDYFL